MSLIDFQDTNNKLGNCGANNKPLCPKPRRLGPSVPEFLKPFKCSSHTSQAMNTNDTKSGVVNLIADNQKCMGCCSCCYAGSPPTRTDNPLVHDLHFIHQRDYHQLLNSPNFARTKLNF